MLLQPAADRVGRTWARFWHQKQRLKRTSNQDSSQTSTSMDVGGRRVDVGLLSVLHKERPARRLLYHAPAG